MAVADNSYISTGADMVSVANKIREKAGVSNGLVFPDGWIETIEGIEAGGGGGSVEPFTKIISGTITFAEQTAEFQLPETENFLAAYFIRTDFWGIKDDIYDSGAQIALFASGQSFGYFSPIYMSSSLYQRKDLLGEIEKQPRLLDGKITFTDFFPFFYGTYYYSLIYGTKQEF